MKKIYMKRLALFILPHAFIMWFCLIMIFLGVAAPFINGFALDDEGKLFVGEGKIIRIYQNELLVREIEMKSSAYALEINSADELIVASPSTIYRMTLEGQIIEKQDDPHSETYQKIRNNRKTLTPASGDKYQMISEFGWTRIVKNGTEEVYRISTLSFVVKVLLFLCSVSLLVNGAWFVRHVRNMN